MIKAGEIPLYEEKGRLLKFLWPYHFRIYEDRVEAYFWPHKQVIFFGDIEVVVLVGKIPWIVGMGLRYTASTKYFAIRSEGIQISMKRGRWKRIVLSVQEPKLVKALIEERLDAPEWDTGVADIVQTA